MTSDNLVSVPQEQPIYAWFDNGTIKLWSEATTIKLNDNSAYLLFPFPILKTYSCPFNRNNKNFSFISCII